MILVKSLSLVLLRRLAVFFTFTLALWHISSISDSTPRSISALTAPIPAVKRRVYNWVFQHPLSSSTGQQNYAHKYLPNGLLEVNLEGRHPILDLISRAEKEWEDKHARQSQSLAVAVREYKRRYGRNPPKGFDRWWKYVMKHKVLLPDEFDLINESLTPFWGFKPSALHKLHLATEEEALEWGNYYILIRNSSGFHTTSKDWNAHREEYPPFMEEVERDLEDFRATISIHDAPSKLVKWEATQALREAASSEEYLDVDDLRQLGGNEPNIVWEAACPPDSALRSSFHSQQRSNVVHHNHTFIYSHALTLSPCNQPYHIDHTGIFLATPKPPVLQFPLPAFVPSITTMHSDIYIPPLAQTLDDDIDPIPWEEKVDERMYWRGGTTGLAMRDDNKWRDSQRFRLIQTTNSRERKDMPVLLESREGLGLWRMNISLGILNSLYTDISFTQTPVQCSNKICKEMEKEYEFRGFQEWGIARTYKYALDVDGNAWSARFRRLMISNSLVMKSTVHPEWWTERIQPWLHYVPIQNDWSDLYSTYLFFRGTENIHFEGYKPHRYDGDSLARNIAVAGTEWTKRYWRKEDTRAYLFRLFLEYARVMSPDRDTGKMDFVL